jgi:hypothetical protein
MVTQLCGSAIFHQTNVLALDDFKDAEVANTDVFVIITDIDEPLFGSLKDDRFIALKEMVKRVRKLLWVSASNVDGEGHSILPQYSFATGWLRSIRSEALDRQIVTLSIESGSRDLATYAAHISSVLFAAFNTDIASPELEYVVRDGILHTGRLFEEIELNDKMKALISPKLESGPWKSGPPLKLAINVRGMLDSLEFVENVAHRLELQTDEIEIEAKAWGLSFRDIFVALGRLNGNDFGYDCAGVVTIAGSDTDFQPGDRVVMSGQGCMRTYPWQSHTQLSKSQTPYHLKLPLQ